MSLEWSELDLLREDRLLQGELNDCLFSLLRDFSALSDSVKTSLALFLLHAVLAVRQALAVDKLAEPLEASQKTSAKKISFYFLCLCHKAESSSSSSSTTSATVSKAKAGKRKAKASEEGGGEEFDLSMWRRKCLQALKDLLLLLPSSSSSSLSSLWPMGIVEETFTQSIWRYCLSLLEDRPDQQVRQLSQEVIVKTLAFFPSRGGGGAYLSFTTALLDALLRCEHLATPLAEMCRESVTLCSEVLREVAEVKLAMLTAQPARHLALFIEALARTAPHSLCQLLPMVLRLVDCPVHQIRSAMLQAMASLVLFAHRQLLPLPPPPPTAPPPPATTEGEQVQQHLVDLRDRLLDLLLSRGRDSSPYTRATSLKAWHLLIDNEALPVRRVVAVAEVAVDRLRDRNHLVRRQALLLLGRVVETNPFAGHLPLAFFERQREEVARLIQAREEELKQKAEEGEELLLSVPVAEEEGEEEDMAEQEVEEVEEEGEVAAYLREDSVLIELRAKQEYVLAASSFASALAAALPRITSLLGSKITSDVVESLHFLVQAVHFRVEGAMQCFAKTFALVWHGEAAVRQEVVHAFQTVYLRHSDGGGGGGEGSSRLSSAEMAYNILQLIRSSPSQSFLVSLDQLLREVFRLPLGSDASGSSGSSGQQVVIETIQALLLYIQQSYSLLSAQRQQSGVTVVGGGGGGGGGGGSDVSACLQAISMLLNDSYLPDFPHDLLVSLVRLGFHNELFVSRDYLALRMACLCVQRYHKAVSAPPPPAATTTAPTTQKANKKVPSKVKGAGGGGGGEELLELCMPHLLRLLIEENLRQDLHNNHDNNPDWFGAAEEAVHAVFLLHPTPEEVLASILHHLYASLAAHEEVYAYPLAGFVFLLGQTAVHLVVLVESLSDAVKATEKKKQANQHNDNDNDHQDDHEGDATTKKKKKKGGGGGGGGGGTVEDFEEQMGQAAALEAEHDRQVNQLIEEDLLLSNLLGAFLPLLQFILANDDCYTFTNPALRSATVMTVCRYMTVSSLVCEQLLALAFTVLESDPCLSHRTTILVALGDLAFRFPNALEPWTDRLYAKLRDDEEIVRYNALLVVTHLVLNDMIKVKNQVYQVALSLLDDKQSIANMAKLFFLKLSERSHNPVYNLLGDIISRLSSTSTSTTTTSSSSSGRELSTKDFQYVMHFLLSFVQKDKQADQLLDRLLLRLLAAEGSRAQRCLAFCLSELVVSEKGLKRLLEAIKSLRPVLQQDEEVVRCFEVLLSRARRTGAAQHGGGAGGGGEEEGNDAAGGGGGGGKGNASLPASTKALIAEVERALHAAQTGGGGGGGEEGDELPDEAAGGGGGELPAAQTKKAPKKKSSARLEKTKTTTTTTTKKKKVIVREESSSEEETSSSDTEEEEEQQEEEESVSSAMQRKLKISNGSGNKGERKKGRGPPVKSYQDDEEAEADL
eukprot:scaffold3808_cov170-Ochromonas_danica.AAC.9